MFERIPRTGRVFLSVRDSIDTQGRIETCQGPLATESIHIPLIPLGRLELAHVFSHTLRRAPAADLNDLMQRGVHVLRHPAGLGMRLEKVRRYDTIEP